MGQIFSRHSEEQFTPYPSNPSSTSSQLINTNRSSQANTSMTSPNTTRPSSRSHFFKTVCLGKWWLIKAKQEVDGKSLAVAGSSSSELGAVRVFVSAPVIKRHDMLNLETSDGVQVVLQGFIDKFHTAENGFSDEVFDYFVFGFPTNWEECAERCFIRDEELQNCSLNTEKNNVASEVPKKKAAFGKSSENSWKVRIRANLEQCVERSSKMDGDRSCSIPGAVGHGIANNTQKRKAPLKKSSAIAEKRNRVNVEEHDERCAESDKEISNSRRNKELSRYSPGTIANDIADDKPKKKTARKRSVNVKSKSRVKKKLNYDIPVTPCVKESDRPAGMVSPEIQGLTKSRSGRVLLPTLEFWRNQKAVYNADKQVTEIVGSPLVLESPRGNDSKRRKRKQHS